MLVLQTAAQAAAVDRSQIYAAFIDLQKVYDCIDCCLLFSAFVEELGISASTMAALHHMYTDIRAQVVVDGALAPEFPQEQGALQGCPASPLVFSLFMDRLKAFILQELECGTVAEHESVRVAGLLLPLLLFADDLVLLSHSLPTLQRLLAVLAAFCAANGLTVNLGKSAWVVGGCVPRGCSWTWCITREKCYHCSHPTNTWGWYGTAAHLWARCSLLGSPLHRWLGLSYWVSLPLWGGRIGPPVFCCLTRMCGLPCCLGDQFGGWSCYDVMGT